MACFIEAVGVPLARRGVREGTRMFDVPPGRPTRTVVKPCPTCGVPVFCVRRDTIWPIGATRIVHTDRVRTLAVCPSEHPVEWVRELETGGTR